MISEDLNEKTDEELENMREEYAPNAYVSGSGFHVINREIERRHRKRLESAPIKQWYEKPFGLILIGVIIGVIVSAITYYFFTK